MTQEASALLACELQKNPQCTGKELVKVLSSSGIHVTPSTVNRHLVSGAMARDGYLILPLRGFQFIMKRGTQKELKKLG